MVICAQRKSPTESGRCWCNLTIYSGAGIWVFKNRPTLRTSQGFLPCLAVSGLCFGVKMITEKIAKQKISALWAKRYLTGFEHGWKMALTTSEDTETERNRKFNLIIGAIKYESKPGGLFGIKK